MSAASRAFDVIVFGATGFTGGLTAQYLAKRAKAGLKLSWAIAGRSLDKLNAIEGAVPADLPRIVADSSDVESLQAMASQTRVVISTVGPYTKYGTNLVAACVASGTHYCDLTGEFTWVREMVERFHSAAQLNKTKIVFCCGYDCIPSDLGCLFAINQLPSQSAKRVRLLTTGFNGSVSGGTLASSRVIRKASNTGIWVQEAKNPYALAPDIVSPEDTKHPLRVDPPELAGGQTGSRFDREWGTFTLPFVMAQINCRVVRRSLCLRGQATSYDECMSIGGAVRMLGFTLSHLPSMLPTLRNAVKPGDGPSESVQRDGSFSCELLAESADGRDVARVRVRGRGDPGYSATAVMLAECALSLALDSFEGGLYYGNQVHPEQFGCLTPSVAMGSRLIRRLEATGRLSFERIGLRVKPRL